MVKQELPSLIRFTLLTLLLLAARYVSTNHNLSIEEKTTEEQATAVSAPDLTAQVQKQAVSF